MHLTKFAQYSWVWGVLLLGAWSSPPASGQQPDTPPPRPVEPPKVDSTGALIVPLQGSVRLQMKNKQLIRDVFNTRDDVITVEPNPIDPSSVIVTGSSVGISRVTLTDVNGRSESYQVVVQPDIELLRNLLRRAVPTANIDVTPVGQSSVLLSGNVANAEDVDVILRVAGSIVEGPESIINAMTVGGTQQVQLDVVVASVSRTEARNRGFNFGVDGSDFFIVSILGGLASPGAGGGAGGGQGLTSGGLISGTASNIVFGVVPANFGGFLQALRNEGLAKLLAEPKLVTQSGRPAYFLAGGQQAVLGQASGINGPGVTFQNVGTQLTFLPIVYGNGKIYLEVAPTITNVNQARGITTSFGTVPGFDEQSVRTSVVMEDGQTFAIGGLIQSQMQGSTSKVPYLGDVPFVGPLFSVVSHTETEQELVILVTPHLVDPMDCNQLSKHLPGRETRSPSDFELFMESLIEAPRGQRPIFENGRYKAAYKNDPTYRQYPCGLTGTGADGSCGPLGAGGYSGTGCPDGSCYPGGGTLPPAANEGGVSELPLPEGAPYAPPATLPGEGNTALPQGVNYSAPPAELPPGFAPTAIPN